MHIGSLVQTLAPKRRRFSRIKKMVSIGALALSTLYGCNDTNRSPSARPVPVETDSGEGEGEGEGESVDDCENYDKDNDGFYGKADCGTAIDCDDTNENIYPTAEEICDRRDNNCNGITDEGVTVPVYRDADRDGRGTVQQVKYECSDKIPPGWVGNHDDCRDNDPNVYRGAIENCNSIDDDCDGAIDEGCSCAVGDSKECGDFGHGTCQKGEQACDEFGRWGNCVGNIDPIEEICDGEDNDCDTFTDDGVKTEWFRDADGDTYGDPNDMMLSCDQPEGYVDNFFDCDDIPGSGALIHPGVVEICNMIDDDCNGQIDEGATTRFWDDTDGDGYGNNEIHLDKCDRPPGYVANNIDCDPNDGNLWRWLPGFVDADGDREGTGEELEVCGLERNPPPGFAFYDGDCNDNDPNVNTSAHDVCNDVDDDCDPETPDGTHERAPMVSLRDGVCAEYFQECDNGEWADNLERIDHYNQVDMCDNRDNDCDGQTDEDGLQQWFRDADGDGRGDAANSTWACAAPPGYVLDDSDCHDGNTDIWEIKQLHRDNDRDRYGVNGIEPVCAGIGAPDGWSERGGDCEDGIFTINPGADDICDNVDNDCNPETVDGTHERAPAIDLEGGVCRDYFKVCVEGVWDNQLERIENYGAEVCDGEDNNCNGEIDEGTTIVQFQDLDRDNYGDPLVSIEDCELRDGFVEDNTDCEILDARYFRLQEARMDFDGDGFGDENMDAADVCMGNGLRAGYSLVGGDCVDNDPEIFPFNPDVCDNKDNDCNDQTPDGIHEQAPFVSLRAGVCTDYIQECEEGVWVDNLERIENFNLIEVCDYLDNNCNGQVDEDVKTPYHIDRDADGFGTDERIELDCELPEGYSENNRDCDDFDADINPDAIDICDSKNNDCDDSLDEGVERCEKILYTSRNDQEHVFVVDVHGNNIVDLTPEVVDEAENPQQIPGTNLVSYYDDDSRMLIQMNVDGSDKVPVVDVEEWGFREYDWNSSGEKFTFPLWQGEENIATYNRVTGATQIHTDHEREVDVYKNIRNPTFSRDGSKILYQHDIEVFVGIDDEGHRIYDEHSEIRVTNLEDGTDTLVATVPEDDYLRSFNWNHTGERINYHVSMENDDQLRSNSVDGNDEVVIETGLRGVYSSTTSPVDDRIALTGRQQNGAWEDIFTYSADQGTINVTAHNQINDWNVRSEVIWSRDGSQLVYNADERNIEGSEGIYLIDAIHDGNRINLTGEQIGFQSSWFRHIEDQEE